MGVYRDTTTNRPYVEFSIDHIRYKKRLPSETTDDQAQLFEQRWRTSINDDRIKRGLNVFMDMPTNRQTGNNLRQSKRSDRGILYVIQSGENYKIGITDNFEKRLRDLQSSNPHTIQARLIMRVSNAGRLERALHHLFRARRIRGEWFKLDAPDLELLQCIAGAKVVLNRC